MKGIIAFGTVIVLTLSLAGCATPVPISSVKAPTIDTSNMQRLGFKDFENKSGVGGPLGAQLTQYLTEQTRQRITNTGKFTIVLATDPNADGVFTGEIRSIVVNQTQEAREKTDKEGNPYIETTYKRDVSVEFQYSVLSSRTGMPVGTVTKRGSQSDAQTDQSRVAEPLVLARRIVDAQLRSLQADIVPTIVQQNVSLMNETSKDKVVKQRMKEAQVLVKNRNYAEAIRQYEEIDTPAARNNAGLLRRSIESDASARSQMAALDASRTGLTDKAAKDAVDALYSQLTIPGTAIMIVKEGSQDRGRLDQVVSLIETKIADDKNKLKLVDRSSQIKAEQDFQTSGDVGDKEMVAIGKQIGAKYIVFCSIIGEMSARELQLTVVSIETSAVTVRRSFAL